MSTKKAAAPGPGAFLIQKHSRTLAANVTNRLRDAITSGKLKPRQALVQETLADQFGVSRVPIREALKELAGEGLVVIEPHRGAFVSGLSVDELDELYSIVWALEREAVLVAVPKLTDDDIKVMADLLDKLRTVKDPGKWYALSNAMHRTILLASGWTRCLRMVDECRKNIGRYITEHEFFAANVTAWLERNEMLFRACKARDARRAVAALEIMRKHSTAGIREHVEEQAPAQKSAQKSAQKPSARRTRRSAA